MHIHSAHVVQLVANGDYAEAYHTLSKNLNFHHGVHPTAKEICALHIPTIKLDDAESYEPTSLIDISMRHTATPTAQSPLLQRENLLAGFERLPGF